MYNNTTAEVAISHQSLEPESSFTSGEEVLRKKQEKTMFFVPD
jgi:hypothetical protein